MKRYVCSAVLCTALLVFCAGCMHKGLPIAGTYRIIENAGNPMLVPGAVPVATRGAFQSTKLSLAGPGQPMSAAQQQHCAIASATFALHPVAPFDSLHWVVQSLSINAWNQSSDDEVDTQWTVFTRMLASLKQDGCFPLDETAFAMQRAIAQTIPLTASATQNFAYSFGESGFVNLLPGMALKIEALLPRAGATQRILSASYQVISRPGGVVSLQLASAEHRKLSRDPVFRDTNLFKLSEFFARYPVLRLFLGGISAGEGHQNPLLLGAQDAAALDAATLAIEHSHEHVCPTLPNVACVAFQQSAVSIYSELRINNRRTLRSLGTSLALLLQTLPNNEQPPPLTSVTIRRPLASGSDAAVLVPSDMELASHLILLPGDKIMWPQ